MEVAGLNKLVVVAWFPEIRREHLGDFHFEKEGGIKSEINFEFEGAKTLFWREERSACLQITPIF